MTVKSLRRAAPAVGATLCVTLLMLAALSAIVQAGRIDSALDRFDREFAALDQAHYATVSLAPAPLSDSPYSALRRKTDASIRRVLEEAGTVNQTADQGPVLWRAIAGASLIVSPAVSAEPLQAAYQSYVDQAGRPGAFDNRKSAVQLSEVSRTLVAQQADTVRRSVSAAVTRAIVILASSWAALLGFFTVALAGRSAVEPRDASARSFRDFSRLEDVAIRVSQDGSIVEVQGAVEGILGQTLAAVVGTPLKSLAREKHAGEVEQFIAACRKSAPEAGAIEVRAARAGQVWYRIEPMESRRNTDRTSEAVVFRISDISKRRETEEALRQSSEMLRTLTEASPLAITIEDTRGRVKLWNPACARTFGWSGKDVLGQPNPTIPKDRHDEHANLKKQVLQGHAFAALETERTANDGRLVQVSVSTAPLRDATGRTWGVMEVLTDITEHKVLEAQLLQSQKMEGIGRLTGGIAHDFNNLLTAILGQADMLLRAPQVAAAGSAPIHGAAGPSLADGIEQIKLAAARAAHMTSQLLAFSRNQTMQPIVLDLNSTIGEIHEMVQRLIGEDVDLVTIPSDGLDFVKGDPTQITQVLINLAVNARDAMPNGGKLTIETANVVLDDVYARRRLAVIPGAYAMLAVSDNGHGMSKETQARIFEPFFTTKPRGKGTGLGLSTVYGIVKQSGGYIWCYSEPGVGTSFKIYLPAVHAGTRDQEVDAGLAPGSELPDTETPTLMVTVQPAMVDADRAGAETVLLVEDEEMVRSLVRQVLTWYGYKVLEAHNGESAIRVAKQYPGGIDLMITDLVMPGMSALDMVRALVPTRPGIRVLYMSGYTDHAVVRHHLLHPGIPFIQKPFAPDRLAHKVREVLDGPRPSKDQLAGPDDLMGAAAHAASSA